MNGEEMFHFRGLDEAKCNVNMLCIFCYYFGRYKEIYVNKEEMFCFEGLDGEKCNGSMFFIFCYYLGGTRRFM